MANGVEVSQLPAGPTVTGLTGARPNATRFSFPITDHVSASVDVATGNLMVTTTGIRLVSPTSSVPLGATYNSLSTLSGSTAFSPATGWNWAFDGAGGLSETDAGVVYTGADGSTWLFTPVSGSSTEFTSPAGLKEVLVKTDTGYTLTDLTSRQVIGFGADGLPQYVADRNGVPTSISWEGAAPTGIQGSGSAYADSVQISQAYGGYVFTQSESGATRTMTYSTTSGMLTNFDFAGASFSYTNGLLTSIDAGAVTDISYDSSNRVTQVDRHNTSTGSPGTSTTRLTYPSATQTLVAGPNTSTATAVAAVPHTTYTIDANRLVTAVTDAAGRVRSASYTPNMDVASSTVGSGSGASTTTGTYGANGGQSLTAVQAPGGATGQAAYENTSPATQFLPSSITDDAGNQSLFTFNGAGNALTSQNAMAATATLTYNADGTVATAAAPGNGSNVTRYGYTHGQLTSITPVTGSSLGATTITYDHFLRPKTVTNGNGVTTTYGYDNADRLLSTTFSDGTHSVVNTYDSAGHRLTRVDGSGTTTSTYDQLGRLTSVVNTAGGGTISYGYDKASNLISTTDTRGTTTYDYDPSGVVTQINFIQTNPVQPPSGVLGFTTDDHGRRTDEWMQTNDDHTLWSAHTHTDYDTDGHVTRVMAEFGTGDTHQNMVTSADRSYCYNSVSEAPTCSTSAAGGHGKIQWARNNMTGLITPYTYDAAGRLTGVDQTGYHASTYAYTYDANGNRLTATVTGTTTSTQTLTANPANQISSTGYTYDGDGNLTGDPAGTYTYNGADQMTGVTHGGTTYDYTYAGTGQNELLSQDTPDGLYQYTYGRTDQQGQPIIEQITAAGKTAYLDHDPVTGQALLLRSSSGKEDMYVFDGLGNPIGLITDDAYQDFKYNYDPYGVPTLSQNSGGGGVPQNPYLFKGGVQDRTTGWVHYGARWYDPTTGRWTQQDIIDTPLDPANANKYAYAGDDPINNLDPSGRSYVSVGGEACALVCLTGSVGYNFGSGVFIEGGFGVGVEIAATANAVVGSGTQSGGSVGLSCTAADGAGLTGGASLSSGGASYFGGIATGAGLGCGVGASYAYAF